MALGLGWVNDLTLIFGDRWYGLSFAPFGGSVTHRVLPRAYALGCILVPPRGCAAVVVAFLVVV